MIVLIDNYDSFVWNLRHMLHECGASEVIVVRNDAHDVSWFNRHHFSGVVLSPGPCRPEDSGVCMELVSALSPRLPLLGVCLGHQALCAALGATIERATLPMHGKLSSIHHDESFLFAKLPSPLTGVRYHSLIVNENTLPTSLKICARAEDGLIMAVRHDTNPWFGLQFHPESIAAEHGHALIRNFLAEIRARADTKLGSKADQKGSERHHQRHNAPVH